MKQPLALGGHAFVTDSKKGELTIWRCLRCHYLVPSFLLKEKIYYKPCRGLHKMIGG